MDASASTLWWVAAGALVAIELATGTFYLLMLALGAAAAALAAHAGLGSSLQLVVAAVVGGGATAAWHVHRARSPRSAAPEVNPDVQIDLGQRVRVEAWDHDGSARVKYRGANWAVRFAGQGEPLPGEHVIVAVHGNQLSVSAAERG